jgi:hypothetical protein
MPLRPAIQLLYVTSLWAAHPFGAERSSAGEAARPTTGPANLRDEPGTEAGRSPSGPVSDRPCSGPAALAPPPPPARQRAPVSSSSRPLVSRSSRHLPAERQAQRSRVGNTFSYAVPRTLPGQRKGTGQRVACALFETAFFVPEKERTRSSTCHRRPRSASHPMMVATASRRLGEQQCPVFGMSWAVQFRRPSKTSVSC